MTPVAFSISGAVIYLAVYKFRLFDVLPIARRTIVENMQDGMLVLDLENRILDFNPVLETWIGKTHEKVIGRGLDTIFPDSVAIGMEESWQTETPMEFDTSILGKSQTLEARTSMIFDHLGNSIGRLLLLRDVTERKKMEQSLWQANQALADALELNQQIISSSAVGMLAYAETGQCVMVNEAAGKITRMDIDRLEKLNFRSSPGWKKYGLLDAAEKTLATRIPDQELFQVVFPSSEEAWIDCYFTTFTSQERLHLLVLIRDVTELKELERDLEEAKVLLEQAFEQSPVPIALLSSPGGIIEMLNPACRVTLKIAHPDRFIGTPVDQDILDWEVREPDGCSIPRERWPLELSL